MNFSTSSRALLRPCAALKRYPRPAQLTALRASRFAHVRAAPEQETETTAGTAARIETFVDGNYTPIIEAPHSAASRDARFQVVGTPYSLLSVSLSASQNLYTRRGTLVGLSGKAENVVSRLQMLEPFRRSVMGIPFLYQKISSTSPVNALISTRSPVTSFSTVEVDGTTDWMIAQPNSLLAWTGYSLRVTPSLNQSLSLAYWGNSRVTGRGLLALVGRGQIYTIDLQEGEKYVAHPSNVLAYTINNQLPSPYRFRSTFLNLQVPDIGQSQWLSRFKFIDQVAQSVVWKKSVLAWHTFKTWARRTIWGDRLFLQFEGPARILIQSRGSTINESLTTRQVAEIADAPPGVSVQTIERPPRSPSQPKTEL